MKKVLAVLLAVCMIAALGATAHADADEYGWGSFNVERMIFAEGLVTLTSDPFVGMTGVTSVVFPSSVKTVAPDFLSDSAVTTVQTAGDVAAFEDVDALADAEVSEISAEDFAALVAEVEEAANVKEATFSYDADSKTLLVKGLAKLPTGGIYYDITEEPAAGGDGVVYIYDDNGVLIGIRNLPLSDGGVADIDFEYDEDGRMIAQHVTITNSDGTTETQDVEFEYTSDTTRTVHVSGKDKNGESYSFDVEEELVDNAWVPVNNSTPSSNEKEVA